MAFCTKCGKQLADGEVCTCITTFQQEVNQQQYQQQHQQEANQQVYQQEVNQQLYHQSFNGQQANNVSGNNQPADKVINKVKGLGKRNKLLVAISALVVVVLLLVIIISSKSSGHMEPVDDFIEQINKRNTNTIDLLGAMSPDFAEDSLKTLYKAMLASDEMKNESISMQEMLEEYYDECNDEYDKWKLSFDMKSESMIDKDELKDLQDEFEDFFESCADNADEINDVLKDEEQIEYFVDSMGINTKEAKSIINALRTYYMNYVDAKITQAYKVKGKFIITADGDEYKTNTITFVVAKVKGDWVYCGIPDDYLEYFEDEEEGCFRFIRSLLKNSYLEDYSDFLQ